MGDRDRKQLGFSLEKHTCGGALGTEPGPCSSLGLESRVQMEAGVKLPGE